MDKPIRVLHVLRYMNIGGAETFIMNLYRSINKNEIQFDFLVHESGMYDKEIEKLGGRIYIVPYITDIGQFKYCRTLKSFFNSHKEYKIIHSHLSQVSGLILECAKKCNIPIRIAHSHSSNYSNNILIRFYKEYLGKKIFKNATDFFACSDLAAKWLFKNKSNESIIIKNCISIEKFMYNKKFNNNIRKALHINLDTFVVGHVGRFNKVKNHEFLIDIFYEIQKRKENSILVLCGAGELKLEIENKVNQLNIKDKVIFTGIRQDVNKIYSAFNIMIFPSIFEGLPLTLIEAQINGLKVFCSDTISNQVNVSNEVKFISLDTTCNEWSNIILNSNLERRDYINKIIEAGYDSREVALKLQEFYCKGKV